MKKIIMLALIIAASSAVYAVPGKKKKKEAEKTAEKFRKEMKTEEAYRVKSMADQIAELCSRQDAHTRSGPVSHL